MVGVMVNIRAAQMVDKMVVESVVNTAVWSVALKACRKVVQMVEWTFEVLAGLPVVATVKKTVDTIAEQMDETMEKSLAAAMADKTVGESADTLVDSMAAQRVA